VLSGFKLLAADPSSPVGGAAVDHTCRSSTSQRCSVGLRSNNLISQTIP